jgi:hypothetical protein
MCAVTKLIMYIHTYRHTCIHTHTHVRSDEAHHVHKLISNRIEHVTSMYEGIVDELKEIQKKTGIFLYMYICNVFMCMHMYVYICMCMYLCVYIYMYVCVYVCVCVVG